MDEPIDDAIAALPAILPIFPLPGSLLLPRGHLPLHIFEPRYRAMTEAALGNSRLIGMVQPRDADADLAGSRVAIYDTGCAGRIVQFAETEDGRFFISLRGVCRFRIIEELPQETSFRRVRADFHPFRDDIEPVRDAVVRRERLIGIARSFLEARGLDADWAAINDASDEALVTALAMTCPFEPREKQALLETPGLSARADLLISIMEIAICDQDSPAGGILQ
jgi:uncharacterized protein